MIRIVVKILDFGGCKKCGNLKIFDGPTSASKKLGEWTDEKPNLVASRNKVLVTFTTNRYAETDGVEVEYQRIRRRDRMLKNMKLV